MHKKWIIQDTGAATAKENMSYDAHLLQNIDQYDSAVLHLYDWIGSCATYGLLVNPDDYLDPQGVKKMGLNLAQRPTGGGIIFHKWDFAFSVAIPCGHVLFSDNTLTNYRSINEPVLKAAKAFLGVKEDITIIPEDLPAPDLSCSRFCMAQPTKYDVVLHGKKIAGAAQRKTKKGFLHQGTISMVMPDPAFLAEVLHKGTEVLEAMVKSSFPLLGPSAKEEELASGRKAIKNLLIQYLTTED
jgi:lipoate-protein ligase A